MKKYSMFNKQLSITKCLICIILCGCITEYNAPNLEEIKDILVVEGIITDDETTITLSRSINLTEYTSFNYLDFADVYVECDDGTQWKAVLPYYNHIYGTHYGRYVIKTGALNPERKYRLKIEIEEPVYNRDGWFPDQAGDISNSKKTYEYYSDFSHPIKTPEIDSIFWRKKGRGEKVFIHVTTHDTKVLYYRWSYREDWEIRSDVFLEDYPYFCWNNSYSTGLLIGSAEKTVVGKLTDMITDIDPWNRKLAVLYRITIKQNGISKRAYDYFDNIKKNAELTGSIFAPIPSELRGNIVCVTDPSKPVIGYIDVSSTTINHRYISLKDNLYEMPRWECYAITLEDMLIAYDSIPNFPENFIIFEQFQMQPPTYINVKCVDCTNYGTEQKPDDWPDRY